MLRAQLNEIQEQSIQIRERKASSGATIEGFKAIGVVGRYEISGFIAWLFWSLIHLIYLIGYKSKIVVVIEWIFAFFLNKRGTRLIYRDNK